MSCRSRTFRFLALLIFALGSGLGSQGCLLPGDAPFEALDAEGPELIDTVPMPSAVRVPPDAVILLAFSEPLAAGQPAPSQLQLRSGELVVPLSVEPIRPALVRLRPDAPLLRGARYRLALDAEISDSAFNPLTGDRTLAFTVSPRDDPLTVESSQPTDGERGLDLRPTLRLSFDVPLSPLTLEPDRFLLEDPAGQGVRLQALLSETDTHVLELTPVGALAPATRYTLTVSPALRDVQSRHLALPFVLSFTTG